MKKIVAVITGDLINSSGLNDDQKKQVKEKLESLFGANVFVTLPLQFYRGDSFQLLCTKEKAAWAVLMIEAVLISITGTMARISIGIGSVSRLHETDVLQSEGEAFTLSGQNLDAMKADNRTMVINTNNKEVQDRLAFVFKLIENIVAEWKPGQASVVALKLQEDKQKDIAARLEISPAAVSKTLTSAKWHLIEEFLGWYETVIEKHQP
jgi:hypothetical protein